MPFMWIDVAGLQNTLNLIQSKRQGWRLINLGWFDQSRRIRSKPSGLVNKAEKRPKRFELLAGGIVLIDPRLPETAKGFHVAFG